MIPRSRPVAHATMWVMIAVLVWLAFDVSYPNVCALFGIYTIASVALYQLLGRLGQTSRGRMFGFVGRTYALAVGLTSFYLASDAYVLEVASRSYPATWLGFVGFGIATVGLAVVTMLRRSTAGEIYVTHPQFVSIGIALFVAVVTVQLLAMTSLGSWELHAVLYRVLFIASMAWLAHMGVIEESPSTIVLAGIFLVIGVLTAYLDILWSVRETQWFLVGAALLALVLSAGVIVWSRGKIARMR